MLSRVGISEDAFIAMAGPFLKEFGSAVGESRASVQLLRATAGTVLTGDARSEEGAPGSSWF